MKLQGVLSEQTIIERLGFDYLDEKNKKDSEAEDNMLNNIARMEMLNGAGAEIDDTTIQEQTGKDEISTSKTTEEIVEEADAKKKEKEDEKEEK